MQLSFLKYFILKEPTTDRVKWERLKKMGKSCASFFYFKSDDLDDQDVIDLNFSAVETTKEYISKDKEEKPESKNLKGEGGSIKSNQIKIKSNQILFVTYTWLADVNASVAKCLCF